MREFWSTNEEELLTQLWRDGESLEVIAKRVGRSFWGTRDKVSRLGLRRGGPKDWKKHEESLCVQLWNANVPAGEIAARLGRTKGAVLARAHELRLKRRGGVKWTDGHYRIMDEYVERILDHVQQRTGHPRASIRTKLIGRIMRMSRRDKIAGVDLGGMTDLSIANASKKSRRVA